MATTQGARRGNLGILTGALFVLCWVAGSFAQDLTADKPDIAYPRPTDGMAKVQKWFEANGDAASLNSGLQIIGGIALLVFAGVIAKLLLTVNRSSSAGSVAAIGGAVSAAMLLVGAAGQAGLGTDAASDGAAAQALYQITFWTGGPLHVAALGVMVAAAATGLGVVLPKWLKISGQVVGGLAMLATLSGISEIFVAFTLFGRYLCFVWLLIVTITMAVKRSAPASAPAAEARA
ncbi:MAG TPA: hypothetical protein VGP26_23810 [Actinophytocola sp.]|jgi:hypothetical protein|nr:hypothetical protein [Actinophytocola sp.]